MSTKHRNNITKLRSAVIAILALVVTVGGLAMPSSAELRSESTSKTVRWNGDECLGKFDVGPTASYNYDAFVMSGGCPYYKMQIKYRNRWGNISIATYYSEHQGNYYHEFIKYWWNSPNVLEGKACFRLSTRQSWQCTGWIG